jgi:BirA family biotin operon repressor/biotin-[acetyl-CoA-carboxylase] ligase
LPSTSTYAKENASNLPVPTLIISDHQTAGRGRQGKTFYSPRNTGLYFTLLFDAKNEANLLTPAAAVAVCKAVEEMTEKPLAIKWVNDIFIDGKKICGILTERYVLSSKALYAVGIGINLTTKDFPEDLTQAGSLNITCNKEELAIRICELILEYANEPDNCTVLKEYEKRLFIIGKEISYHKNGVKFSAKVNGINNLCNLIVTKPDGENDILSSGEISVTINSK